MLNWKKYNIYLTVVIVVIAMAGLNIALVYFENKSPDSGIHSFGSALWYMIVTLSTVGYGDKYPLTPGGIIIGSIFVFGSLGVLGYLVSTISNKYHKMMEDKRLGYGGTNFENHILFIGWTDFSRMVADEIYHTNKKIAIVTPNKDDIDLIYAQYDSSNVFVLFADFQNFDILKLVNADKAGVVFISTGDDAQVLLYVLDFRKRYAQPQIVVSLENSKLKDTFEAAGVTYAIARNEIASKLVASYIFEPDVAALNHDLISAARKEQDFDIQEYAVTEDNPYAEKDFIDAFFDLKKDYNAILMGLSRFENGVSRMITNPAAGVVIRTGDYLVLMCDGKVKKQLVKVFGVTEGRIFNH